MKASMKFVLAFGMLVLALILACVNGWTEERTWIFFAVVMAFIGDMCLMTYGLKGGSRKKKFFLLGIVHFAIAHIFYSISYLSRVSEVQVNDLKSGIAVGLGVSIVLVFCTLSKILTSGTVYNKLLFRACILYSIIISITTITIFVYAFSTTDSFPLVPAVGISLFFASDCLIAVRELLRRKTPKIQRWIWILYVTGQTMLILG